MLRCGERPAIFVHHRNTPPEPGEVWQTKRGGDNRLDGRGSPVPVPSPRDPLLGEIVRRLTDVYRPERIYLFGSTARGDAGPDSDYDLMIVLPDDAPADKKDPDIGYTAVEGLPRSGDFLIWTRRNFDSRLHLKASLPSTVLREGMLLYAA